MCNLVERDYKEKRLTFIRCMIRFARQTTLNHNVALGVHGNGASSVAYQAVDRR
jgi:hypothetical protein